MLCPDCRTDNAPGARRCAACTSWIGPRPRPAEWTRARADTMIAGVCRGLANRFGIPVAATRFVAIASVLLGGWGLLAYLALWIAMPLEPLPAAAAPAPPAAPPAPAPSP